MHSWLSNLNAAKVHVTVFCACGAIVLLSESNYEDQETPPIISVMACTLENQFLLFFFFLAHIHSWIYLH